MFKRSERLRELFLQEISLGLREVKDPGLSGFITVTGLTLSGDMRSASVFYSLLGSSLDRAKTQRALDRSVGFLRQRLFGRLRVKYVPKLVFVFDETPGNAHRIETLLNRIHREETPAEAEPPAPDADAPPEGDRHGAPPGVDAAPESPGEGLHNLASRASRRARKRRR
ncbi:MAG: 30S ribosome-binding factor RbfA [Elusimicrobiota bacterium]